MENGILRVSETATADIEAARAFVIVNVTSQKVAFGNAALTASTDLQQTIDQIKQKSEDIEVETESVSVETSSGILGKNSSANYTVKFIVKDLSLLGDVLGVCSEGKNLSIQSLIWDYDEEEEKFKLIKQAVRKAKTKADGMMAEIGYAVVGIRSCSDSYQTPSVNEICLKQDSASELGQTTQMRLRGKPYASARADFGAQFKNKRKVSATCTIEFFVQQSH